MVRVGDGICLVVGLPTTLIPCQSEYCAPLNSVFSTEITAHAVDAYSSVGHMIKVQTVKRPAGNLDFRAFKLERPS